MIIQETKIPKKIRNEIIKNIKFTNYFNIGNRTQAIKTAVMNAEPGEIILVAGKGHEKEQIYKNKIISISDSQIIKKLQNKNKETIKYKFYFFTKQKNFRKYFNKYKGRKFPRFSHRL